MLFNTLIELFMLFNKLLQILQPFDFSFDRNDHILYNRCILYSSLVIFE